MNWMLGLLMIVFPYSDDDHSNKNKNGNDCNRASAECNDNDFSPSFDKSPVEDSFNPDITLCLPFARCGQPEESDSESEQDGLMPS